MRTAERLARINRITYACDNALQMLRDGFPLSDVREELRRRLPMGDHESAQRRLEALRAKEDL